MGGLAPREALRTQAVEHHTLPATTPVRTGLRPPGGPCPGAYNGRAALHLARVFISRQDPYGACSLIRDASGEGDLGPKGQGVHVDAADHIPVSLKGTLGIAAAPLPPFDFLFPAAYRTLA